MKNKFLFYVLPFLVLTAGCKNEPDKVINAPLVVIDQPVPVATYHNNDTLLIQGTLSDDDELHEASVMIRTTTDTLFSFDPFVHELQTYPLDTFWIVNGMSTSTPSFLTVIAANHHDKVTEMNVPIFLAP